MCCLFGFVDYGHKLTLKQRNRLLSILATACEARGTDATGISYNVGNRLSGIVVTFFKSWKENLKTATFAFLGQMSILGLLVFSLGRVIAGFDTAPWLMGAMEWILVLALIGGYLVGGLLYAQIARYELPLAACWKNGFLLMLANPVKTIANGALFAILASLYMVAPGLFLRLGFVWPLFGCSLIFHLSARLMRRILKPLEERSGNRNELSDQTPA